MAEEIKSCVAVDPSVNNCGMAIFIHNKLEVYDILHPSKHYAQQDYLMRARDITNKLRSIYLKIKADTPDLRLVTEVPDHFGNSGYISRETGAVYALTFVAGMIFGIDGDVVPYKPRVWKGQMNKCVVRARLSKVYLDLPLYYDREKKCPDCGQLHRENNLDHNIVDAIGIGHKYIFGRV